VYVASVSHDKRSNPTDRTAFTDAGLIISLLVSCSVRAADYRLAARQFLIRTLKTVK